MKTKMINPKTFQERKGLAQLAKMLSMLFIAAIVLFASCRKDKKKEPAPTAQLMVSTFAGTGVAFKDGASATFNNPYGIAVDQKGNVYVADTYNDRIRKISPEGVVSTLAGGGDEINDNCTGAQANFNDPYGVAVDQEGNVYVADMTHQRIRKITTSAGGVGVVTVSTLAGSGIANADNNVQGEYADGAATEAKFDHPMAVAVDIGGNVYVADNGNDRIRKISTSASGVVTVSTLAGGGTVTVENCTGAEAKLNLPTGVAVDENGNVYVADSFNHSIRKISLKQGGSVLVSTFAGSKGGFFNGTASVAQFSYPRGIAIGKDGHLYVADSGNHRIRKISPEGKVSTLAGSGYTPNPAKPDIGEFLDGKASAARFNYPGGVAAGADGKVYAADAKNHRIRKIE